MTDLDRLLDFAERSRLPDGGFGYNRHSRPDLSNSHFAIQALHDAGLKPGDPAYEKALVFISRCQNFSETNDQPWAGNDGGFVYSAADGGESSSTWRKLSSSVMPSESGCSADAAAPRCKSSAQCVSKRRR